VSRPAGLYPGSVANLPDHLMPLPVGREQLSRETLAEHQRARILDAAVGVFAKRGYRATTIDHLVAASKSSVGGFYAIFSGKEDCFLALYDGIVGEAEERIAAACAEADDWADRALLGLHAMLEIFSAEPLKVRIVLVEIQTVGPPGRRCYDATIDAVVEWLRAGRGRYPAAAELPSSFEAAAVGGVAWYLQQSLESSAHASTEELFDDIANLLLEAIVGDKELARRRRALAGISA